MTARMVNATPTANANLAGFGAMYPLLAVPVPVLVPIYRTFRGPNRASCVNCFTLRISIFLMETIKDLDNQLGLRLPSDFEESCLRHHTTTRRGALAASCIAASCIQQRRPAPHVSG